MIKRSSKLLSILAVAGAIVLSASFATAQPAAIRVNYGLQRHRGGGLAVRTIACLPAVVGAWRDRAGGILLSTSALFPLNLQALQRADLVPSGTRTVNMVQLAEALNGVEADEAAEPFDEVAQGLTPEELV